MFLADIGNEERKPGLFFALCENVNSLIIHGSVHSTLEFQLLSLQIGWMEIFKTGNKKAL